MTHALPSSAHRLQLLLMMLVGLFALSFSNDAAAQAQSTSVRVDVILASNAGTGVDAQLSAHRGRLLAQFPNFDSFRSAGVQRLNIDVGGQAGFTIPGGGRVTLTYVSAHGGRSTFDVAIPGGSARVETRPGGLFFVGGPRSREGTVILMISAG